MARADVECAGQALLLFQYAVVAAVKEVFKCAAHVPKVFGGAQHNAIAGENIRWARLERRFDNALHRLDVLVFSAMVYGTAQCLGIDGGRVSDD